MPDRAAPRPTVIVREGESLPTAAVEFFLTRAVVQVAATADEEYVCLRTAAGGYAWVSTSNVANLAGKVSLAQAYYTFTLGPFFLNDAPGSATTNMGLGYFNTATALSQDTNRPNPRTAGEVIGAVLSSDAARTAGTATLQIDLAGTPTAFNAGAVVLDGTFLRSAGSFVLPGHGVAFTNAQSIAPQIVTTGWTPTTANLTAWLVCLFIF